MRRYNPGLVTAVLLFIPLAVVTLWTFAAIPGVTLSDHFIGFGDAIFIHAAILTRALSRKRHLGRAAGTQEDGRLFETRERTDHALCSFWRLACGKSPRGGTGFF